MPTPIVYEGVNSKYEGTLFNGIKFWENGGKIVLLEKLADVLIADHAKKKLAPAGSVSWKYIEASVAKGELVNIEDHRIHDVEVKRSTKGTKVPFSKEDDRILVSWVRQKEKAGDYLTGNKIYQELEKSYPQHTWQSWRDRWVKKLAILREEDLPAPLPELPPPRLPRGSVAKDKPVDIENNQTHNAEARKSTKGRTAFTREEEQILLTWVRQKQRAGEQLSGNKIYKELEGLYPQHSWHSWRDKWVKQMAFLREEDLPAPLDLPRPSITPTSASKTMPSVIKTAAATTPSTKPTVNATPAAKPTVEQYRDSSAASHKELANRWEQILAARTIQRVWRGYIVRRDIRRAREYITVFQAIAQGYMTRRVLGFERACFDVTERAVAEDQPSMPVPDGDAGTHLTDAPSASPRLLVQTTAPALTMEEFWGRFNMFNELTGAVPTPWVQICWRTVDFWELWRCATAQPRHGSRDWQVICEDLGFDWVAQPDAPMQVKAAFEQHLLEFENALREFDQWDSQDTEEEEGTQSLNGKKGDRVTEENQEDVADREEVTAQESEARQGNKRADKEEVDEETASQLSDDIPSSVPLLGLKRSIALSSSPFLGSVSKRLRYDPSSEIPCTPEARAERAGQGPAGSRGAAAIQETPTRRRGRIRPSADSEIQSLRSPSQLDGANDNEELLTSSHQLLSEFDAVSPAKGTSRNDLRIPTNQNPLPVVESEDESTDSSDAFEPVLPTRAQRPEVQPRRRTLPRSWSNSKGKAPAGPSSGPAALPPPRQSVARTQIPSSSHAGTPVAPRPKPAILPPSSPPIAKTQIPPSPHADDKPATISFSAPPGMRTVVDPLPITRHFIAEGYPWQDVSLAAKLTTCHKGKMRVVLDSLARGDGIPWDMAGVWTKDEDNLLRGIGRWVDRMRMVVPRKEDRACFGNDDGRRAVFWRLAGKHGGFAVLERWAYLRARDQS
ncbi:Telomeric repeat-binding factor 2-interacting protein 1 [Achaetomium macrosporum]|uniref:DNA-binding protein RAP1 n=1 Tax=Achaetomium macrosporum TaxID=79813 RepID=A0AAN7CAY9_9PEZI|nr:Telomeric repeat-binding factor 2-interacting protein 1 [Achaetomium macrosporum]